MAKKIIIATIVIVLLGAVSVGAYDAYQGNSTLSMPDVLAAGSPQAGPQQGQNQMGGGQIQGQGRRGNGQMQSQGQMGNGQMQGQGQMGNGQQVQHEWQTLTGTVVEMQPQGLLVDTAEQGELLLNLGQPGFAAQQNIGFNPGDAVTIDGFAGDEGLFVAGVIRNEANGQSLQLRDPNGRPLWAGPGRMQNGQGSQGRWSNQDQMQGQGQTGGSQQVQHEWQTLTGRVIEMQPQGLLVDTVEQGELLLNLGRPGFADQQNVTFNPGDAVTIDGFAGDQGFFVAGVIRNEANGQNLQLRDPNGRPLWAGPGGMQNGQGGQGRMQNGQGGQGRWKHDAGQPQQEQSQTW
jgi:hypothetical protein